MAELTNLVNAHPRAGMQAEVHDMRPFLRNLAASQRRWVEDCISDDNDSMSSRLSNKSDKNLGDFDDENSVDEEMLHLAQSLQHHQQLANMASFCQQQRIQAPRLTGKLFIVVDFAQIWLDLSKHLNSQTLPDRS